MTAAVSTRRVPASHRHPWRRRLVAAGLILCLGVVALGLRPPDAPAMAAAGRAWAGASALVGAIPIGALILLMTMRLVRGGWSAELAPAMSVLALLVPLAAVMRVPLLLDPGATWPWVGQPQEGAFRSLYLSPAGLVLRMGVWFAVLGVLAAGLVLTRGGGGWWLPSLGLILVAVLGTLAAVDQLMSLDPAFLSSGFGLYLMSLQMVQATAAAVLAAGLIAPAPQRPGVLGGLLLSFILLWAYLAYLQYFIIWSTNLPEPVGWDQRRAGGPWPWVIGAAAAARLLPALALVLQGVRRHPRRLAALSVPVMLGTALEFAWIALPGAAGDGGGAVAAAPGLGAVLVFALGAVGQGAVLAGGLLWLYPWAWTRAQQGAGHG